jgi:hypothetical protein|tara:strand:- start:79726 stop:80031 length:306 start_codon:yes stop_codon:yes gene_type:complete
MAVSYSKTSPYNSTIVNESGELGILEIRPIPAADDDIIYTIEPQYNYRPDLLAFDLYGSAKLWWVFAQRNMDVVKDPVFDIESGTKIFLPKQSNLKSELGI